MNPAVSSLLFGVGLLVASVLYFRGGDPTDARTDNTRGPIALVLAIAGVAMLANAALQV